MNERSHFTLVIPSLSIRWYPAGEHCADPQTGDILLVDHGTLASAVVEDLEKVASWREPGLRPYAWCGHAAIIRTDLPNGPTVSEMGFKGYERRPLADYRARRYAVVNFDAVAEQRLAAAQFDDAMAGADYGWLEYPAMGLDDLTGLQLSVSNADHLVCSAATMIVAGALGFMGDRLPVRTEPMRIAYWVGALPA